MAILAKVLFPHLVSMLGEGEDVVVGEGVVEGIVSEQQVCQPLLKLTDIGSVLGTCKRIHVPSYWRERSIFLIEN
jgi:hypothetical protein